MFCFLNTSVVVCLFPSSLVCYTKRVVIPWLCLKAVLNLSSQTDFPFALVISHYLYNISVFCACLNIRREFPCCVLKKITKMYLFIYNIFFKKKTPHESFIYDFTPERYLKYQ